MSNRYRPHLLVLPEDEADQAIANGLMLSLNINQRAVIIDKPAKGWKKVVCKMTGPVADEMRRYPSCHTVLLIDFDCKTRGATPEKRFREILKEIPDDLQHRVFVLGALTEPEGLKRKLNLSFERIGEALVEDCPDKRHEFWDDELLGHNHDEMERLMLAVRSFLFAS